MIEASLTTAFLGGLLTLLSPCSALLLPAFFAYSSQSRIHLLGRTLVFYLGLIAILVPLGVGASWVGQLFVAERELLIRITGVAVIVFGLLQLFGRGFRLLPAQSLERVSHGEIWFSPLLLGAMYGFAGFCSGPILGAVLTVAASTERTLTGASLLAVYALGMSAPLFMLASFWGRLGESVLRLLRGREMTLGRLTLHTTNIVAGVLFVALGTLFILFDGTTGLTRWYDSAGLSALAHTAETWFYAHASDTTWGLGLLGTLAVIGLITWGVKRRRAAKHPATDLYSKASFREREHYEKS